jgi:hypothetical protein
MKTMIATLLGLGLVAAGIGAYKMYYGEWPRETYRRHIQDEDNRARIEELRRKETEERKD